MKEKCGLRREEFWYNETRNMGEARTKQKFSILPTVDSTLSAPRLQHGIKWHKRNNFSKVIYFCLPWFYAQFQLIDKF